MKILIIRFSSIGDIVLTTPVIRCIRKQLPDAVIHYLTKEKFRTVLEHNPYIDHLFTIKKGIDEVMIELVLQNYDLVIDLHHNLRTWRVKMQLKSPSKAFDKINLQKWLIVNLKINRLPRVHIVDRYLEAAASLGIRNDGQGLDFFLDPEKKDTAATLPAAFTDGYVAIVIGGQHQTKIYPADQLVSVCRGLSRPVVLLGGPEDAERGAHIAAQVGATVFNACGKYSLMESAWLLNGADHVVTNDTGLMHIAAALHKDITSIWGNTIPGFGMAPYLPADSKAVDVRLEVQGLKCRPCSKIGYKACPRGHFKCMKQTTPEAVIRSVVDKGR